MTLIWTYGVRNTTLLTVLAFVVIGVARRRPSALLAVAAWLVGFEAAWQWSYLALSTLNPHMWKWEPDGWAWIPVALAVLGPALAGLVRLAGLRADRRWVLATVALWLVWVVQGLHANYPGGPFDVVSEVINVAVKTSWALAYLVPLAQGSRSHVDGFARRRRGGPAGDLAESGVRMDAAAKLPRVALEETR